MRRVALLALGLALGIGNGCAYRSTPPPVLDEPLRVRISSNQTRLVQSQLDLQQALTEEIASRLGWHLDPLASAVLEVHLAEDEIVASRHGNLRIANRWRLSLVGSWTLQTDAGRQASGRFRASGNSDGLRDEAEAIAAASRTAAAQIVDGLENRLRQP